MAKDKELELFDDSDMQMIMMMIMMVVVMSAVLGPVLQQSQVQAQSLQAQSFGGNEDPRHLNATNRLQWINLIYDYPFQPWVSVFIINDGPSAIEIGINYPDDRFLMYPGETRTITRTAAQERINILFYICSTGLLSTIRATGVY